MMADAVNRSAGDALEVNLRNLLHAADEAHKQRTDFLQKNVFKEIADTKAKTSFLGCKKTSCIHHLPNRTENTLFERQQLRWFLIESDGCYLQYFVLIKTQCKGDCFVPKCCEIRYNWFY